MNKFIFSTFKAFLYVFEEAFYTCKAFLCIQRKHFALNEFCQISIETSHTQNEISCGI